MTAQDAVIEAIQEIVRAGDRAYSQNVPGKAVEIYYKAEMGRISMGEAEKQIRAAIEELVNSGKINAPAEPRKDWTIV